MGLRKRSKFFAATLGMLTIFFARNAAADQVKTASEVVVSRWRDGQMVLRWVAGAYLLTEKNFRGVGLLTPAMVHYGQAETILRQRQTVLHTAYQLHPERFVRQPPRPTPVPTEAWINKSLQNT